MFICNHCPFVKHVKKDIVKLTNLYMEKGIGVVAISSNSIITHPQDGPVFMAEDAKLFNYPFPYLYDHSQDVARDYGAVCTPEFYLFKKVGTSSGAAAAAAIKIAKRPESAEKLIIMVKEAIVALKERTGSSQYAIAKHIEDHQKDLPANFKKMLLVQLKKLVAAGKLVKVKNSFKLGPGAVEKPKKSVSEKKAPAAVKKSVAPATTAKSVKKVKTPGKAKKAVKRTVVAKKPKSIKSPVKKLAPKKKVAAKK